MSKRKQKDLDIDNIRKKIKMLQEQMGLITQNTENAESESESSETIATEDQSSEEETDIQEEVTDVQTKQANYCLSLSINSALAGRTYKHSVLYSHDIGLIQTQKDTFAYIAHYKHEEYTRTM